MATIPTAYTWTVGELVTAAKMNAYLRDLATFLLNRPYAQLTHNTTQSIPDSTMTPVSLNTETSDSDSGHSTSTNNSRYTAATAGVWTVHGTGPWVANTNGKRELHILKNGLTDYAVDARDANRNVYHSANVSCLVDLGAGDYASLFAWQNSGGALNLTNVNGSGQRFDLIWERV